MDDLLAFLRARLDEDADLALAASPGPWHPDDEHDEVLAVDGIVVAEGFALSGRQLRATVDHIARHDPARVLDEVDAKRRALDQFEYWNQRAAREALNPPRHPQPGLDLGLLLDALNPILMDLARPYAKHPDFKARWWIPESPEEDEEETPPGL